MVGGYYRVFVLIASVSSRQGSQQYINVCVCTTNASNQRSDGYGRVERVAVMYCERITAVRPELTRSHPVVQRGECTRSVCSKF